MSASERIKDVLRLTDPNNRINDLADLLGLTWGGNWKVRDYGHFEI